MSYNRLQTMRDNINAIRLALRLDVEHRNAENALEREILRKYAGFGGLKCILQDANELADAAKWSKSDIELFAPTVELRRLIHDYSKDDREFAAYMDSLKASVLTAFYTPAPIIDALATSLRERGVKIKKFLEPSAGQGAFIDSFLKNENYPGTIDWMKNSSSADIPFLPVCFCRIIKSEPVSVPALSEKVLFGNRTAPTRSERFISSMRTKGLAAFITPCDVIKATIPPSCTESSALRKK